MKRILLGLLALSCASVAFAQVRRDPATVELVYRVPAMESAHVLKDREFAADDGQALRYDAYLPTDAKPAPRAAIVFVSGASSVRDWRWYQDHGRIAATKGFVGLVPDKRYPHGDAGTAQGMRDTEAFLKHVADNADALGIDPTRICLWVFSAGGRIAVLPYRPDAPAVRCLVGFYPILDGASEAVAASNARKLPALIVRAGRDSTEINASIAQFGAAAFSANQPVTLINLPEADHGFEGLNDTDFSRAAMERTYAFLVEETER